MFQRLLCARHSDDAIATGFQQEGTDGEDLFVIVYAKDGFLRAHAFSLLPDATLWWLAADGPERDVFWFAAIRSGVFSNGPAVRPKSGFRSVVGRLLPESAKQ